MKKLLKIMISVFVVAAALAFAGCDFGGDVHQHDYTVTVINLATCKEKGEKLFTCSCGDTYSEDIELNPIAHIFEDDVCTICGRQPSEGLEYTLSEDGMYYTVSGMGTCTDSNLIISATHEDLPVKSIGVSAFSHNESITSLMILDGITTIETSAFHNCSNLAEIALPDSVTKIEEDAFKYTLDYTLKLNKNNQIFYIGKHLINVFRHVDIVEQTTKVKIKEGTLCIADNAFKDCTALTSVEIPATVTHIGVRAFRGCISLESVDIPNSVIKISEQSFRDCSALEELRLGTGVKVIGDHAFYCCKMLTDVEIPQSVVLIETAAFANCEKLINITIHDGIEMGGYVFSKTAYYNSQFDKGVLYLGNYLLHADETLTNCVIKEGTLYIAASAFRDCTELISVHIPESVIGIGEFAFALCGSLESVNIPKNIIKISESMFAGCSNLKQITLPDGITHIEKGAFSGGCGLEFIAIPQSVVSIEAEVFQDCYDLERVLFQNPNGWKAGDNSILTEELSDTIFAKILLCETYCAYDWTRE